MPETGAAWRAFDFAAQPVIVAAVSGGSDSTALLILLKDYIDTLGQRPKLVAVTVDHALRPESADEAASVGVLAKGLGVAHRIVTWTDAKPATGLAAAARQARYMLLAGAAHDVGATTVVTGHTADDQAETVAMREMRGGGRGLAGMAPATLFDGKTWIVRPLLDVRRDKLRCLLQARGIGWAEDPSNANQAHERVRTRAALGRSEADTLALLAKAMLAAQEREALGGHAALLIQAHASALVPGLIKLAPEFLTNTDAQAQVYALRMLLAVVGGMDQLPNEARVASLFARLSGPPTRATLSRTVIEKRRDGIYFRREARHLPDPAAALDWAVWDGRYCLRRDTAAGHAHVVAGAMPQPATALQNLPDRLLRAAAAAQPSFRYQDGAGTQSGWNAQPIMAPWSTFLPSFDLSSARAVAALIGAALPPAPPFVRHDAQSP